MGAIAALTKRRFPALRKLAGMPPVLWAAPVLAGTSMLPAAWATVAALAAVIVLGVPHGALDGEIARDVLRPRLGPLWFVVFAIPYLTLSASVMLAWQVWPVLTLGAFLAVSTWHFGEEDAADASAIERFVRGGLPIAVPTLAHPAATSLVLAGICGEPLRWPPAWLIGAVAVWTAAAAVWVIRCAVARRSSSLLGPGLLVSFFVLLPPLTAFAIYFVCVHAPAHTGCLIGDRRRACRVVDERSAILRAIPFSALTVLIGCALWPLYDGPAPGRLLALTLQGLAALTLPHLLLDLASRRLVSQVSSQLRRTSEPT